MSYKKSIVETSCLGCVYKVIAFKDEDPKMHSMHITYLSDHAHLYQHSWRGRIRAAWKALTGDPWPDIDLMCTRDIINFANGVNDGLSYLSLEDKQ